MIPYKDIKTIFFDYDGTIHNSIKVYAPAFKKAYSYLVEEGLAEPKEWNEKEISYWLGFNSIEMWKNFMPELSDEYKNRCRKMIGEEIKKLTEQGKAVLYEGALQTLEYLKSKGYHLIFISNCGNYYMNLHNKVFNLDKYFEEMVCSEKYKFIPKYEILQHIMKNYPKDMVIVGDRKHDVECGKYNNIYAIGCSYGFAVDGEIANADLIIDSITELEKYF